MFILIAPRKVSKPVIYLDSVCYFNNSIMGMGYLCVTVTQRHSLTGLDHWLDLATLHALYLQAISSYFPKHTQVHG